MANKTRTDLVEQVARNLGILTPGDALSAEDSAAIDSYIDGVIESLAARDVIFIPDSDDIEPMFFHSLAICIADEAKSEFGAGQFDVAAAEQKLRRMTQLGPTYAPQKAEYF